MSRPLKDPNDQRERRMWGIQNFHIGIRRAVVAVAKAKGCTVPELIEPVLQDWLMNDQGIAPSMGRKGR